MISNYTLALVVLQLAGIFVTLITFLNIKFNDLKHMGKDLEEVKESINTHWKRLESNTNEIGKINVRCSERHGYKNDVN